MKKSAYKVSAILYAVLLSSSGTSWAQAGLTEQWTTFGASAPTNAAVSPSWAGAMFYRTPDSGRSTAANIYVNGEYLASLLPGGYRYAELCPYNQRLASAYTGNDRAYNIKENAGDFYDLPQGYVSFFKVVDGGAGPVLQAVDRATASYDIAQLREQTHTLPRLEQNRSCAPELLKQYNIDISALFRFDKYDYKNMLPEGKQQLQQIAADSYQYRDATSVIHIEGYTDPEGKPAYNKHLSERRAQTVKRVMIENGFNPHSLKASGHGERNLIVTDCRTRYPRNASARAACDQPNRRVEIKLYGKNYH
ncbi:MAG: OmpA family protein [Cardiobacteriaceae bacterium]|nr:OmpA family protein [Cardiobacteriaceae bacterium]